MISVCLVKRGTFIQGARRAGLWLALIAFALKSVIPQGYMIGAVEGQRIPITLCSLSGGAAFLNLETGAVEVDGKPQPQKNDGQGHCPFALTGSLTLPLQMVAALPPRDIAIAALISPRADQLPATPTGPPPPARGPPSFA
ncbi:MAG: hypothetical protein GC199_01615 [Alphaproteobacteria bacterium]|nr:hypothetical protein [Alphaproteobacteria bacterium]